MRKGGATRRGSSEREKFGFICIAGCRRFRSVKCRFPVLSRPDPSFDAISLYPSGAELRLVLCYSYCICLCELVIILFYTCFTVRGIYQLLKHEVKQKPDQRE